MNKREREKIREIGKKETERHFERKKEKHSESYVKLTKLNIIILALLGTLRDKKTYFKNDGTTNQQSGV